MFGSMTSVLVVDFVRVVLVLTPQRLLQLRVRVARGTNQVSVPSLQH